MGAGCSLSPTSAKRRSKNMQLLVPRIARRAHVGVFHAAPRVRLFDVLSLQWVFLAIFPPTFALFILASENSAASANRSSRLHGILPAVSNQHMLLTCLILCRFLPRFHHVCAVVASPASGPYQATTFRFHLLCMSVC